MRNYLYTKGTATAARRLAAASLLLFAFFGNAWAQSSNDPKYVFKKDNNYLAHVEIEKHTLDIHGADSIYWEWEIQNVMTFNPNTCLWQSGPNIEYNFYFVDTHYSKYHYLNVPLQKGVSLSLSGAHPGTQLLNAPTSDYYFYNWDHGAARGMQHYPVAPAVCPDDYNIPTYITQCWEVVWVSYNEGWKTSSIWSYNPTAATNAAPRRHVTVTPHDEEKSGESGGVNCSGISDFSMEYGQSGVVLDGTADPYTYTLTPAYTLYDIEAVHSEDTQANPPIVFFDVPQELHYYYEGSDHPSQPGSTTHTAVSVASTGGYTWTITGAGDCLSFVNDPDHPSTSSNIATPTLYYVNENTSSSHILATLTLTVKYETGATQTCTATVTVITQCQNPQQASAPVVTYEDVTVSWRATALKYKVWWKKHTDDWSETNTHVVENATSYAITGLEYGEHGTDYDYKVSAYCGDTYLEVPSSLVYTFKTKPQPKALVYGCVFGGGRMADVVGKTEVVIINCDSITAVFGGNDIAGKVQGADGSSITLGVDESHPDAVTYNNSQASTKVRVRDIYGGGNGYYAYNGTSFEPASYNTEYDIADGASIKAMTQSHQVGDAVWTNNTGETVHLLNPRIQKTNITVTNNSVVIDSLFGGAKNAILQNTDNDVNITINGGTIFAVFGGNNYGGSLGYMSHEHIVVNNTVTVTSYGTSQSGRDFGIRYLFGGGNKVMGQHVDITVTGGQCDTVFGGGNAADVRSTTVLVNCELGTAANGAFGKVYSDAISSVSGEAPNFTLNIDNNYKWDGTGIYNIRTLFGGNNKADMAGVPTLTLTSGGIGTAYGGGNAGDMLAQDETTLTIPTSYGNADANVNIKYGTLVEVTENSNILIDNLYGGCQMSNVYYSALTEVKGGHVGTVYGGCNISGDVGSTRVNLDATPFINVDEPNPDYQEVYGASYVVASGGTVYKDLFAGSNGKYHCNDGIRYVSGLNYDDPQERYVGMLIPTHNETYAIVKEGAHIKGNVYAGANMAPVGFTVSYVSQFQSYPQLVGLAAVHISGGTVDGNVFGGGNMASINGSNEVQVSGGSIGVAKNGALYGGNDRTGQAGQISNRILPESYQKASDNLTSLAEVKTYIGITGYPTINTVYGGGNGLYEYFPEFNTDYYDYSGPLEPVVVCDVTDLPIQSNIFVDIALEGGAGGQTPGHIDYVYGGGNGVTADGFVKVFVNVQNMNTTAGVISDDVHIGTVFGGNNIGELDVPADIILFNGHVGDVYGGCNAGGMSAYGIRTKTITTVNGHTYNNIGSYVQLLEEYDGNPGDEIPAVGTNVRISGNVYGGCRMNNVEGINRTDPNNWVYVPTNTLVLVEAHIHSATLFGGCDISGNVSGTSQVVMAGGHVNRIFGGGNGNYDYTDPAFSGLTAPSCSYTQVDLWGGSIGDANTTGQVFGGGWGQHTTVTDNVAINFGEDDNVAHDEPLLIGDLYGGSALGTVNTNNTNNTTIHIDNGAIQGNVYGGGLGDNTVPAKVYGVVHVYVGRDDGGTYKGKATLIGSAVYGSNNVKGSPQDDVFVDIYQTAHTTTDAATYTSNDRTYAIYQVFGGGNQADYAPDGNEAAGWPKKTYVTIHGCDNTIEEVFGGSNAADADGVYTVIDGGRFSFFFGGGNGIVAASNVYGGGTYSEINGGRYGYYFGGSNRLGSCTNIEQVVATSGPCGEVVVDYLFSGGNMADQVGDLVLNFTCAEQKQYLVAYGGCRLGSVYGNITINVHGGTFGTLFGGCQGASDYAANVKKYDDTHYPDGHSELIGTGGNITINMYGGAIGDLFGGCDVKGNVEGKIIINVADEENACGLFVGNVYGASNSTGYAPVDNTVQGINYQPTSSNPVSTPEVNIIKGTIGGSYDCDGNGVVENYEGNVFGGGNKGTVTANPIVRIGNVGNTNPVTINGSVYGGGNEGNVEGSPKVIIVPTE